MSVDLGPYSKGVRTKARKLVKDGGVARDEEHGHIWWVTSKSTVSGRPYRVEVTENVASCSCKYGLIAGGGDSICSHVLAVRLTLDEMPGPGDFPPVDGDGSESPGPEVRA